MTMTTEGAGATALQAGRAQLEGRVAAQQVEKGAAQAVARVDPGPGVVEEVNRRGAVAAWRAVAQVE